MCTAHEAVGRERQHATTVPHAPREKISAVTCRYPDPLRFHKCILIGPQINHAPPAPLLFGEQIKNVGAGIGMGCVLLPICDDGKQYPFMTVGSKVRMGCQKRISFMDGLTYRVIQRRTRVGYIGAAIQGSGIGNRGRWDTADCLIIKDHGREMSKMSIRRCLLVLDEDVISPDSVINN